MSEVQEDQGSAKARRGRGRAVRLGVLLGILIGLVVYLALPGSTHRSPLAACLNGSRAPEVRDASPAFLSHLREDVSRVVPQRAARLYEEGTVRALSAFSDEEPSGPLVSASAKRPAGYEMRWWAPNGDDLVADEYSFASASMAQRFVRLAASARCRTGGGAHSAPIPPQGHNLSWVNPDGVRQADVYVLRGERVFRLADAPAGQQRGLIRAGSIERALVTVDTLACLLPGAACEARGSSQGVPA